MLQGPAILPDTIKQAIILCHGYGSNGDDMAGLASCLSSTSPHTGFFCPNAPTPILWNGYEWFSLSDYSGAPEMADKNYLNELVGRTKEATYQLIDYIENIKQTYALEDHNIILGGFSQGGLMALYTGLFGAHNIAGIIGCSTVPIVFDNNAPISNLKRKIPILLTHGTQDDVVPVRSVDITKFELQKAYITPTIQLSNGLGHGIDDVCIKKIALFIHDIFSQN